MKKEKNITFESVEEFEVVDVRFYILKGDIKKYHFSLEPRAQIISLVGFDKVDFFIVKDVNGLWTISESLTGRFVYISEMKESKLTAMVNATTLVKEKVKNQNGLIKYLNTEINVYGLSPRYRTV